MTYKQFLVGSRTRQRAYIESERKRYTKAKRLWAKYQAAMNAMGVHALNGYEIRDRLTQLDQMERNIDLTHGDTPAMRTIYEARQK